MAVPTVRDVFVLGVPVKGVLRVQPLRNRHVLVGIPQNKLLSLLCVSGLVINLICAEARNWK